jgi:alkylated DNA repair protein (DNA oxidative demethylase)
MPGSIHVMATPEGFILQPDFLSPAEEQALLEFFACIPFGEVRMHGVVAKRRVAHFGWRYSFDSRQLTMGAPIPTELLSTRERAAAVAGVTADDFSEVLVTEYRPGAGIGWHRDAPQFGMVAGISLGSSCDMRFRNAEVRGRQAVRVELPARSIYLLTGSARKEWEHMIPPVDQARWSITFRTLRRQPPRSRMNGAADRDDKERSE